MTGLALSAPTIAIGRAGRVCGCGWRWSTALRDATRIDCQGLCTRACHA